MGLYPKMIFQGLVLSSSMISLILNDKNMRTVLDEIFLEIDAYKSPAETPWWLLPTRGGRWQLIESGDSLLKIAENEWIRHGIVYPSKQRVYGFAQIINNHLENDYLRKAGKATSLFPKGQVTLRPLFGKDRRTRAKSGERRYFGVLFIPTLNV